ncbi:MAG: cytochrome-c peroxidase [Myxococcota bacterium]
MNRSLLFLSALFVVSCKTAETPAPAAKPVEPPPAEVKPAAPTPPPPPKVELPAAPELPKLPLGLPELPAAPEENLTTPEKAELGWKLFYDKRLSKDGSMACAACHHLDKAWTSGAAVDAKVGGAMNKRNAPTMLNLGYHTSWYWDGRMATLEAVSNAAWKGQLGADPETSAKALNEVPVYKAMFERAFGEPASALNVPKALAAYFRTLNSANSPWDRAQAGDKTALTAEQHEGFKVFNAKGCATCHVPPLFTTFEFENVGLGDDPGRKDATKADADAGKFKIPSLRNVALTAPYFHDGSAKTLDEAIAFMAKGGNKNPNLSAKLKPQKLSAKETKALKAFLESLTGTATYTTEPTLP